MAPSAHDLVLVNGSIIDGSGAPAEPGDVAIDGDRIAAIGPPGTLFGRRTIELGGKAVAPGFIDVHTHDDRAVLSDPSMLPKVSQGVTTVVVGNCGVSLAPLALIDAAANRQPVGLDAYPYIAGSTVLKPELADGTIRIMVTWSEPHPELAGRDLADIARGWGLSEREACDRLQPGGACYFQMREDDVQRVLRYPATMIGSDGLPHDSHPHPRLWGTFPRVLGHYARDLGLFTLEQAVHKMTGLSAATFGLGERGLVAPGKRADLVVFDPATVCDRATFDGPAVPSAGIELVMVNGRATYRDGAPTGERAGGMIRRQAA